MAGFFTGGFAAALTDTLANAAVFVTGFLAVIVDCWVRETVCAGRAVRRLAAVVAWVLPITLVGVLVEDTVFLATGCFGALIAVFADVARTVVLAAGLAVALTGVLSAGLVEALAAVLAGALVGVFAAALATGFVTVLLAGFAAVLVAGATLIFDFVVLTAAFEIFAVLVLLEFLFELMG